MQTADGYAAVGERVVASTPLGGWRAVSFVGALTPAGLVAPWALEGG